jgi:hypothetical protein
MTSASPSSFVASASSFASADCRIGSSGAASAASSPQSGRRLRVSAKRASARRAAANDGITRSRITVHAGVVERTRPISGSVDAGGEGDAIGSAASAAIAMTAPTNVSIADILPQ